MNRGFLFATLSRKIKSHVVECQITLLVWPCLSLTEKQCTFNHMIIFNDSISKFYQCNIRGFCRGMCMFFNICLAKKNADAIKFLGILKKYVSKNKIFFCLKKNSNFLDITINDLRYEIKFESHTISKLDFITPIIYRNIHRCLYSLFILFLFFLF